MKMPQIVTVVFVLMLLFGWAVYQGVQQLHRSVTHSDAPDTYTSKIDDVRGGGQIITVTEKGTRTSIPWLQASGWPGSDIVSEMSSETTFKAQFGEQNKRSGLWERRSRSCTYSDERQEAAK
jgi:hypothetical protein